MHVVLMLLAATAVLSAAESGGAVPVLEIPPGERLVVVAPHPDDETLGAGGLIQRVLANNGAVHAILVTAGDGYVEAVVHETGELRPRPFEFVAYGERRLAEWRRALQELGAGAIRSEHLLGFPDGGLSPLLTAHWRRADPERSATTGMTAPPYPEAERGLRYDGDDLRAALLRCLRDARPTLVAFPDPLDRHPDHRATGLFTLLALGDLRRATFPVPRLLAYLIHWPGWPPEWDAVSSTPHPTDALELPRALPKRQLPELELSLRPAEIAAKGRALAAYTTQQQASASLLEAFVRRTEPFTVFGEAELRNVGRIIQSTLHHKPAGAPHIPSEKPD